MRQAKKSRQKDHYLAVLICSLQLFYCTERVAGYSPGLQINLLPLLSHKPLEGCA